MCTIKKRQAQQNSNTDGEWKAGIMCNKAYYFKSNLQYLVYCKQTMTTKHSLHDRHFQISLIFRNPASDIKILILYSDIESEEFQRLISGKFGKTKLNEVKI